MAFFDPEALDRVLGTFCDLPTSLPRDRPGRPPRVSNGSTNSSRAPSTRAQSQSQARASSAPRSSSAPIDPIVKPSAVVSSAAARSASSVPKPTAAFALPTKPPSRTVASAVGQRSRGARGNSASPQPRVVRSSTETTQNVNRQRSNLLDSEDGPFAGVDSLRASVPNVAPVREPRHHTAATANPASTAKPPAVSAAAAPPPLEETLVLSAPTEAAESVRSSTKEHRYFARPTAAAPTDAVVATSRKSAATKPNSTAPPVSDVVSELSSYLSNSPPRGRSGTHIGDDDDGHVASGPVATATTKDKHLEDMIRRAGADEIRRLSQLLKQQRVASVSDDESDDDAAAKREKSRPRRSPLKQPHQQRPPPATLPSANTSMGEEPHVSPPQPAARLSSVTPSNDVGVMKPSKIAAAATQVANPPAARSRGASERLPPRSAPDVPVGEPAPAVTAQGSSIPKGMDTSRSVRDFLLEAARQRVLARSASQPSVQPTNKPEAAERSSPVPVGVVVSRIPTGPNESQQSLLNSALHTSSEHAALSAKIDKRLTALERWLWRSPAAPTGPAASTPPTAAPPVVQAIPMVPVHQPVRAAKMDALRLDAPPPQSPSVPLSSSLRGLPSQHQLDAVHTQAHPRPMPLVRSLSATSAGTSQLGDATSLLVHAIDSISSEVSKRGDRGHAMLCFYPTCSGRGELQTLSRMPYDVIAITDTAFADATSSLGGGSRSGGAGQVVCTALGEQVKPRIIAQSSNSAAVLCEGPDAVKIIVVLTETPSMALAALRPAVESRRRSARLCGWVDFGDRLFADLVTAVMATAAVSIPVNALDAASVGHVAYYTDNCTGHPLEAWLAPVAEVPTLPSGADASSQLTVDPFVHNTVTVRGRRSVDFPRGVTRLNLEPYAPRTTVITAGASSSQGPSLVVACVDAAREVLPLIAASSTTAYDTRCGAFVDARLGNFFSADTEHNSRRSGSRFQVDAASASQPSRLAADAQSPDRSALVERTLLALQYALAERLDVVFVSAPEGHGPASADDCAMLEDRVSKWSYSHPRVVIVTHARYASLAMLHREADGRTVSVRDVVALARRESIS